MPRTVELTTEKVHVAAGILIDADGRLLITGRSGANTMREMWEFPGGKLGPGESSEDALRREFLEELGIEITSCSLFASLEHDYPEMCVAIDFFLVAKWQGTPSGREGQALQWLRPWFAAKAAPTAANGLRLVRG